MINAERGDDALLQLRARDLWQAGGGPSVGDGRVRPDMEHFKSLTKIKLSNKSIGEKRKNCDNLYASICQN